MKLMRWVEVRVRGGMMGDQGRKRRRRKGRNRSHHPIFSPVFFFFSSFGLVHAFGESRHAHSLPCVSFKKRQRKTFKRSFAIFVFCPVDCSPVHPCCRDVAL